MKTLQKVRLINWHRFVNETITLDQAVILSGENGAGKSTILDAIQFAVTCSKAHFNKAAHEKGKRNLNSYIRCKTGKESQPFERTGELSAHICLEFYDDSRKAPFLLGVVMDSFTEEKEPNCAWYLMENRTLGDDLFFAAQKSDSGSKKIKGISMFRTTNKGIKSFVTTISEARKMILSRFGRLEEKFFSLIPKAMAFKPIHDIKDFVYSYVLDEKKVNIEALKQNVRSYQELEGMLEDVKRRIGELERIIAKEQDVERFIRTDKIQEFYMERASQDILQLGIGNTEHAIRQMELKEQDLKRQKQEETRQSQQKEETIRSLAVELQSNSEYQALHNLEQQEAVLLEQLASDKDEVSVLRRFLKQAGKELQKLHSLLESDRFREAFQDYQTLLSEAEQLETLSELISVLERAVSAKKQLFAEYQQKIAQSRILISQKEEQAADLAHKIRELEAKRLVYPSNVMELRSRIREEFGRSGRTSEVRILCEMLEITDAGWQNAVEGYLNTQRFYLLVEPEDFDLALSTYDRMREKKKVYGVGLINTGRLDDYDKAPEGSLAEIVTSKNLWARRYINMVLGKVHRCKSYQELKNYPVSITRQCMRYQNHVVSAISPSIYETPYIGAEAIQRQLEMCRNQKADLEKELSSMKQQEKQYGAVCESLGTDADVEVKYRIRFLEQMRLHERELGKCRQDMQKLKQNQTLIQKSIHLEELKKEKLKIDSHLEEMAIQIGQLMQKIEQSKGQIAALTHQLEEKRQLVQELSDRIWETYGENDIEREYRKLSQGKDPVKLRENYEIARKRNQTSRERAEEEMIRAMQAYKIAHSFGAAESMAGFPEFASEYDKLKNSKLLEYEEQVYKARESAETEFREQFLSRLQENIKQARAEFRDLNRALADISFSREKYEFQYEPKSKMKKYYTMIMDDFNIAGGQSIFSGLFLENHKEVIDELFERLAVEDQESEKTLEYYTDYRSYMDYDIKITFEDGSFMFYSKVSAEKSGGETQTPFYITVAASFIQLYRNSIGGDAVGLIMMDEAFNNMDDMRMNGVLEFLVQSRLQVIIAAPPDKIQYIGPFMDKVLLVLQDEDSSFVEEFSMQKEKM